MDYNTIIIGGGHNGLICAAELAKAGQSVLVLEARHQLGGAAGLSNDAGLLAPEIADGLDIEWVEPETAAFAPQQDGRALTLHTSLAQSIDSITQFSTRDAAAFPKFVQDVQRLTAALKPYLIQPPSPAAMGQLMLNDPDLLRVSTLPAAEWLRHYFESEALLGLLGSVSVTHLSQGPYAQGTGFMFLYQMLTAGAGGYKRVRYPKRGMGILVDVLAQKAIEQGAEIKTGAAVAQILLENQSKAVGVKLADGTEITAEQIISTLSPKLTMFGLVGAPNLPPSVVRRVKSGFYRGSTAKLNIELVDRPPFSAVVSDSDLDGQIVISPSLDYLERGFDASKYGRSSSTPYLNMRLTENDYSYSLSITLQYAPYHLAAGEWQIETELLYTQAVETIEQYAPNLRDLIAGQEIWSPVDLETQFGLTEGSVMQGQMELAQMFALRGGGTDVIENLTLAGAGAHPGGGVTGRPGLLAAQRLLK